MRKTTISALITGLLILGCTEETALVPDEQLLTVWAYVYAGESLDDIKLTSTIPLDSDLTEAPLISDAQVIISSDSGSYTCIEDSTNPGFYYYPGDDFQASTGTALELFIEYDSQVIHSETIVPQAPSGTKISVNTMTVPDFSDWQGMRAWRESEGNDIELSWEAEVDAWYYVTLVNIDPDPQPINSWFSEMMKDVIFPPIQDNHYKIRLPLFTHSGMHRLTVYRVNAEYVDLYEYREQDSRDLQEPITNIVGGLGVFSAFNSTSVTLDVVME